MQNRFKNIKLSFVIMLTTIIVWCAADCAVFGLKEVGVEVGEVAIFGAQAQAAEYYVDQNHSSASNSNPGTEDLPWETFARLDNSGTFAPGDTIFVKAGIYKAPLRPVDPGTPDNYITFKTFEDDEVIIDGSYEVTGWELHSGSIYKASWDSSHLNAQFQGISDATGFVNVDRIFDNDHFLKPIVNLGDMEQTSWHYDIDNKILYVWLSNSSNPNDHAILSTKNSYVSDNCIYLNRGPYAGASYLKFEGFKTRLCAHGILVYGSEHDLEFKNIEILGTFDGIRTSLDGSENIIFENIESHHNRGHGIQINGAYTTVKNCEFHHNGVVPWTRWGGAGVVLLGSNNNLSNNSIHHNAYTGGWGAGVILETWGTDGEPGPDSCHHNVVEYNEIYGNPTQGGIMSSGGDNNKIRKNVIYGMGTGINLQGSGMGGSPTPDQQLAENNEIYNNVLVNNEDGMAISSDNRVVNTLTQNNIFYKNSHYNLWVMSTGGGNIFDYNDYYHEGGGDGIRGAVRGSHSMVADPEFVNLAGYDFSLFSTSPCVDAGTDTGLSYEGSAPDIGAYEYIPTDTAPPTLSNPSPTGTLSTNTTQTTLSLTTNESATCKYSTTPNTAYASITNTFSTTGGTSHSQTITGLLDGNSYNYYVRCIDEAGNPNTDDFNISFSIASPSPPSTTYNILNFAQLVIDWLATAISTADLNNDGVVNTRDLGIMMSSWEE